MKRIPEVFPGWQADELIGRGTYGRVYRASRTVGELTSYAAVKVIDIPRDESEVASLRSMGMDAMSVRSYFEETAQSVLREVAVMVSLKGAPHVVAVEDYQLLEHNDGVGWSVFIRMELLESLPSLHERVGVPDAREVAVIGADICQALQACHDAGVIHRDVKPVNVFWNRLGGYKLGDFGLSRRLDEGSRSTRSRAGTDDYMAPEVETGRYDFRVDIYSLGVMLYRWLNGGRPPFVSADEVPSRAALERAWLRRLSGERPPLPGGTDVDATLAAIVAKAVEPDPADRWQSADDFGEALRAWLEGEPAVVPAAVPTRGADLRAELTLAPEEAARGCRKMVKRQADGEDVAIYVPSDVRDGQELRCVCLGEAGANGGRPGDLLVTVHVEAREMDVDATETNDEDVEAEPAIAPNRVISRRTALARLGVGALAIIGLAVGLGNMRGCGSSEPVIDDGDDGDGSGDCKGYPTPVDTVSSAARIVAVSAGEAHTVGLRSDGTVVAVGDNHRGQCDVSDWSDIAAVSAGFAHTVGLRPDGTVVAVGSNEYGQCDVSDWTDIVEVSAGWHNTVGLRSDGSVVSAGLRDYDEASDWTDIVAISDSDDVVGLRSDGTAVHAGVGILPDVSDWTGLVAVSAGVNHAVGLRSDDTVVALIRGYDNIDKCDVADWSDITAVSAGCDHTVGLRSDGTVAAVGSNEYGQCDVSDWTDMVEVSAGFDHTVGLRSDGTVVAVGDNSDGQCDVTDW